MDLLVLILLLTVLINAAGAPLAVRVKEELGTARAKSKLQGFGPLGTVSFIAGWVALVVWFLYARQTGEWLLFAIPATSMIGGLFFRFMARVGMEQGR